MSQAASLGASEILFLKNDLNQESWHKKDEMFCPRSETVGKTSVYIASLK